MAAEDLSKLLDEEVRLAQSLVDEVHRGRGYQSHYGTRLCFGLGPCRRVERVEIRWIGGETDVFEGFKAGQRLVLVEGTGPLAALWARFLDGPKRLVVTSSRPDGDPRSPSRGARQTARK